MSIVSLDLESAAPVASAPVDTAIIMASISCLAELIGFRLVLKLLSITCRDLPASLDDWCMEKISRTTEEVIPFVGTIAALVVAALLEAFLQRRPQAANLDMRWATDWAHADQSGGRQPPTIVLRIAIAWAGVMRWDIRPLRHWNFWDLADPSCSQF